VKKKKYDFRLTVSIEDKLREKFKTDKPPRRKYLGMSEIGDPCTRRLWLKYHGDTEEVSYELGRIFNQGNWTERKIIEELKNAGYTVKGEQTEYTALDGRFQGHIDGIIEYGKKDRILEIKSLNDASFRKMKAYGIEAFPRYYAQVQMYMDRSGLNSAVFICENKNNQELYMEKVILDRDAVYDLWHRAERILVQQEPDPPLPAKENSACYLCLLKKPCSSWRAERDE
jgi:CRISPR/Cas system-associated exonuclease Cas4 (RecB family)